MKSVKNIAVLLLLSSVFLFTRCSNEAAEVLDTSAEALAHGTWRVDHYFSGTDQTTAYTTYRFTFSSTGALSCDYNASTCTGDWQVLKNVESEILHIQLATPQTELQKLNDRWTIAASDVQTITLKNGAELLKLRRL